MKEEILNMWVTSNCLHKITSTSVDPDFGEEGRKQRWRQGDRQVAMNLDLCVLNCSVLSSRGSSQPRNWTGVCCTAGRFFTSWAIREARWELEEIKLCRVVKRIERNEQIKRNLGDEINMNWWAIRVGVKEKRSQSWLRFMAINGILVSFKEIWNIGERISKGLKVIESIKFNNIIQRRNLISRESKSFTLNNRVRNWVQIFWPLPIVSFLPI